MWNLVAKIISRRQEICDGSEGIKLEQENIEPNIPSSSSSCEVVAATAPKCTQKVCVKGKPHDFIKYCLSPLFTEFN